MNPNGAVASEEAALAAGQQSVGIEPSGPDGLPMATPAGSAAAEVQLGTLPSFKMFLSSKIPSSPVVASSCPRWPDPVQKIPLSSAVAASRGFESR